MAVSLFAKTLSFYIQISLLFCLFETYAHWAREIVSIRIMKDNRVRDIRIAILSLIGLGLSFQSLDNR